tara:strand:+ start:1906 stop:2781 length:876 start_codon:yes stop_codon:yes gene_type:complete
VAKEFHSWNVLLDPVLPAREVVVAYLNECGFSMFEPHEHGVLVHGEAEEVNEQEAELQLEAVAAFAKVSVEKQRVAQENWNAKWELEYPQVVVEDEVGEVACTIRAPFHDIPSSGVDVIVAPQMSFGTGHHATTYLMTARLLSLPLEGRSVLDMGCGTGVLALVAAKAGAASILGIDIEHDAVQNSKDNHALNADLASSNMTFVQGDGSACDDMNDGAWDVVCANIHKNVLVADMPRYARTLKEGGHLLLSGFFEGDVHALEASVHALGMEVLGVDVRDGWACMHCGKPLG